MAHMELPRNVRRRHHNCERLLAFVRLRAKIAPLLPFLIETILNPLGIVSFCQLFSHTDLLSKE